MTRPVSRQTVLLLDKLRETPRLALSMLQTNHAPARRSRRTEGVKRALRDIDYFFIHHRWVNCDIEPLVNQLRQMFLKQLGELSPTRSSGRAAGPPPSGADAASRPVITPK